MATKTRNKELVIYKDKLEKRNDSSEEIDSSVQIRIILTKQSVSEKFKEVLYQMNVVIESPSINIKSK